MRSDKEIFDLILNFARRDEGIRVVVMNGSRVNPNAPKDPFQDFDIACVVRDVENFRRNRNIPKHFGELMILQTPDDMGSPPPEPGDQYAYLMQFTDGVRIDLSFHAITRLEKIVSDSLSVVLLDKDGLVGELPQPSESSYLPVSPTEKQFDDCCNEFWWVTPYVAKGLWRGDLIYARNHMDVYVREELMKMLTWYFGVKTNFRKSPGKMGKHLRDGLGTEMWALLERTYADAKPEQSWSALYAMGDLFRRAARVVAEHFQYAYPEEEDKKVNAFIRHIRELPKDAQSIY
jgi:aminoglycoside 6-adenylyltransferase